MPIILLYAIIALGALILIAECLARLAIRRGRYFVLPPGQRERLNLHRESHPQLEPVVRRLVNAQGERGRSVPRAGRVYRILVVGGSAAECFTHDQDTQWPSVLETRLRGPDALRQLIADEVHVGNIGRSGVDSGSLDVILARILPTHAPLDLIIVMVGASDVLRWLEAGAPQGEPAAQLTDAELFSWNPGMRFGYSPRQTALATWIRRIRGQFWVERFDVARWMGRARKDRAKALTIYDDVPSAGVVLTAFRAHLRSVIQRSRAAAPRVLIVGQPWFEKESYTPDEEALFWNGAVGQAYKGTVTEFFSTGVICALMSQIEAAAAEVADREGVEYLRLQGQLTPSAEYFIDHFHVTPAAAARIGGLVADVVLAGAPSRGVFA